jgi:hypothetical protein
VDPTGLRKPCYDLDQALGASHMADAVVDVGHGNFTCYASVLPDLTAGAYVSAAPATPSIEDGRRANQQGTAR